MTTVLPVFSDPDDARKWDPPRYRASGRTWVERGCWGAEETGGHGGAGSYQGNAHTQTEMQSLILL